MSIKAQWTSVILESWPEDGAACNREHRRSLLITITANEILFLNKLSPCGHDTEPVAIRARGDSDGCNNISCDTCHVRREVEVDVSGSVGSRRGVEMKLMTRVLFCTFFSIKNTLGVILFRQTTGRGAQWVHAMTSSTRLQGAPDGD